MNSYFDKESIQKLREIDLFTYLSIRDPAELVHVSGQTYCTAEHDSLIISNGMWNWFSRGIGGKNAIDYLVLVKDFSFIEACNEVNTIANIDIETLKNSSIYRKYSNPNEEKKEIVLPELTSEPKISKAYLRRRGINSDLIDVLFRANIIGESKQYPNVIFFGKDKNENIKQASVRGVYSNFRQEVKGSDKKFPFKYISNTKNKTLKLFEAPIDLLSYLTMKIENNESIQEENLIAFSGVAGYKNKKLPVALEQYFNDYVTPEYIEIYFDKDEVGITSAKNLREILEEKNIKTKILLPKNGKDINDNLQYFLSKKEKLIETLGKETKELEPDFEKF